MKETELDYERKKARKKTFRRKRIIKEKIANSLPDEIILDCSSSEDYSETTGLSVDVLGIIVEIAAGEIPGIYGMSGGIVEGIAEKLGKKDQRKGIRVSLGGSTVKIDLYIIVEYGYNIIEVCNNLRETVRETVENTTNLKVGKITIHVQGVSTPLNREEE